MSRPAPDDSAVIRRSMRSRGVSHPPRFGVCWAMLAGCVAVARPALRPAPLATLAPFVEEPGLSPLPAPAPVATPGAPAAPPLCSATLRGGGHLRSRAVTDSVGPELAPGTVVALLAVVDHLRRRSARGGDDDAVLAQVRVVATGATGWTFVRPSEFGPACPIRVEPPLDSWGGPQVSPRSRLSPGEADRHGGWRVPPTESTPPVRIHDEG